MPMYEYRCENCGEKFEKLRRMSEADSGLKCPKCQSELVRRMYSAFATSGCGAPSGGGFS